MITPQLQQAIKLLQLTRLELVDMISQEMKENPLLEEAEEGRELAEGEAPAIDQEEAEARRTRGDPGSERKWRGGR